MSREIATFAGGCFWCVEAVFEHVPGVESVVSGYTGGHVPDPTYDDVCGKRTGHAEAVRVTFDPDVVSYRTLVEAFFATHDPTTPNRQGNDVGPQYRSAIFTHSADQARVAAEVIAEMTASGVFASPIVTTVEPAGTFYVAEEEHQGYFRNNPDDGYCGYAVPPKLAKLRKKLFPA